MLIDILADVLISVAMYPYWKMAQRDKESLEKFIMRTNQIRSWMRRHTDDFRDPFTNEINYTQMSEECTHQLDLYEGDNYDIPEDVFEIAIEFK